MAADLNQSQGGKHFKGLFTAAVASIGLCGLAFGYAADENYEPDPINVSQDAQAQAAKNVVLLEQDYKASSRLKRIVSQFTQYADDRDFGDDYNEGFAEYKITQFLLDRKIDLQLCTSADISNGVVQVFKDRILLNADLPPDVQELALAKAVEYMINQDTDHLGYGDGKIYSIGSGRLVPVSKMASEYQKILIPANP